MGLYKLSIQVIYLVLMTWIGLIFCHEGFNGFTVANHTTVNILLMALSSVIAIFTLVFLFPATGIVFTRATNIQMMKKREIIETVVSE